MKDFEETNDLKETEVVEPTATVEEVHVETTPEPEEHVVETAVEPVPVVEIAKIETPVPSKDTNLVKIFAPSKLSWAGVGTLVAGINHVTKEQADKWIAEIQGIKLVEGDN